MQKIDRQQREIIKLQLGREPHNLMGIARYCPFNKPALLITNPYSKEYGVFPTTYWLSCPYLVKEVGKLEDKGTIRELTKRLHNDPEFKRKMQEAHENYRKHRLEYLNEDSSENINNVSADIVKVLKSSGVGGIRDKQGIKCLHTHLADYLVNGQNPVGKFVWEKLDWPQYCDLESNYL